MAVWISCHRRIQPRRRRIHTTGGATTLYALQRAHTVPWEKRAVRGGGGGARLAQQVGERFYILPHDERGWMLDQV